MKINLNGEEIEFDGEEISYEQAVALANGEGSGYTVYVEGHADVRKPSQAALAPGQKIALRHNALVTVSFTDTAPAT